MLFDFPPVAYPGPTEINLAWSVPLTLWLRMLWADSRSETSPQRVGCGLPRESPANIARRAPQRAGRRKRVYPKWLDAEYVKRAGLGYAKYGTKQDSIEGALEELNDMIKHYNSICGIQKEKQRE